MTKNITPSQSYIIFGAISLLILWLSKDIGIFWDNVLFVSRMGNHIYQNGLHTLFIDPAFDPGHPPFIAWWQAAGWKIFGHHLWVSHLVMIPFHLGLMVQLMRTIQFFFVKPLHQWLTFFWIMIDPTLLTQFVLVSPETIQLFFFFLAINGILYKKRMHTALGLALLGIVSYRGMMLCAGLFLFDIFRYVFVLKKPLFSKVKKFKWWPYLVGAIPAISFILWHKWATGWVYAHDQSPWASTSSFVDMKGLIRNFMILGREALDFGRIAVFLLLAILIFKNRKIAQHRDFRTLLLLSVFSTAVIVITSLALTNPMAHRYFLTSYLGIHLLAAFAIFTFFQKESKWVIPVIFVILITGNMWIYPKRIAQGWDASLASMPYFPLREKAIEYLYENEIPINEVATFFPNIVPLDFVDLKGDARSFVHFTGQNKYVFYSTVFNLSDEDYDLLDLNYEPLKVFNRNRIDVILYKTKE